MGRALSTPTSNVTLGGQLSDHESLRRRVDGGLSGGAELLVSISHPAVRRLEREEARLLCKHSDHPRKAIKEKIVDALPKSIKELLDVKKIGHITPSSNTMLESLTTMMGYPVADRLYNRLTRIVVKKSSFYSQDTVHSEGGNMGKLCWDRKPLAAP